MYLQNFGWLLDKRVLLNFIISKFFFWGNILPSNIAGILGDVFPSTTYQKCCHLRYCLLILNFVLNLRIPELVFCSVSTPPQIFFRHSILSMEQFKRSDACSRKACPLSVCSPFSFFICSLYVGSPSPDVFGRSSCSVHMGLSFSRVLLLGFWGCGFTGNALADELRWIFCHFKTFIL